MFADDIDTAVIGGVELEDLLSDILSSVDFAGEGKDSGGFSGAGGAIKEEVREAVGFDEAVDGLENIFVA